MLRIAVVYVLDAMPLVSPSACAFFQVSKLNAVEGSTVGGLVRAMHQLRFCVHVLRVFLHHCRAWVFG